MRKTARPFILLLLLPLLPASAAGEAGAAWLRPARQPLLVIRAARPGAVEKVLSSRLAQVLSVSGGDFSGRLPGLGAKVKSLRAFLSALERAGAEDVWFCLMQKGESLISQTGAMGFELPGAPESIAPDALAGWFAERGLDAGGLAFEAERLDGGRLRLAVGRDPAALREALSGGAGAGREGWRKDLESFLARDASGVGAWLNPRPLLGLVSLAGGPDFRGAAAGAGLVFPDSLELHLAPGEADASLALRLNNLLPKPFPAGGDAGLAILPRAEGASGELTLADPGPLLACLGWNGNPLAAANLDAPALVPRLARLSWWFEPEGGIDWQLIFLMNRSPETRRNIDRLMAWPDVLQSAPAGGPSAARVALPGGGEAWRLDLGDLSLILGMAESGGDVFLLASGSVERYPAAGLSLGPAAEPRLLSWEFRLDDAARRKAARYFAGLAGKFIPYEARPDALRGLLEIPGSDSGSVTVDGRAVMAASRRGTAALVCPFLAKAFADEIARRRDDPVRLTGERLRFLLGVANQVRFRQVRQGGFTPGPWPRSLAELAFEEDPEGREWLERAFPRFPGRGITTLEAIRHFAAGRPASGWRYRIVDDAGGWRVEAAREDGRMMAIDRDGMITNR